MKLACAMLWLLVFLCWTPTSLSTDYNTMLSVDAAKAADQYAAKHGKKCMGIVIVYGKR